jgi:hypothetical protein
MQSNKLNITLLPDENGTTIFCQKLFYPNQMVENVQHTCQLNKRIIFSDPKRVAIRQVIKYEQD